MKHISAFTNIEVSADKHYAWLPTRMCNGKLVWFDYFYTVTTYATVCDTHRWLNTQNYTKEEYFLHRLEK